MRQLRKNAKGSLAGSREDSQPLANGAINGAFSSSLGSNQRSKHGQFNILKQILGKLKKYPTIKLKQKIPLAGKVGQECVRAKISTKIKNSILLYTCKYGKTIILF